ncbi:MAG: AMP-binding protein [Chitinophagales bacterium]|nr:AMP-binding protein [Chitinophagales bacterium]
MNGIKQFFETSTSSLTDASVTIPASELLKITYINSKELIQYIKPRQTVAYLTENSPLDFLICEVLLSHLNCYLFPISFESFKNDSDYILHHVNVNYILLDSYTLKRWIIKKYDWEQVCEIKGVVNDIYLLKNKTSFDENFLGKLNSSIILSTSGTSSNKKFILQSSKNFTESIKTFSSTTLFKNKNRYLNLLPLYFSGGRKVFYSSIVNNLDVHFANTFKIYDDFDITSGTPFILKELIENNPTFNQQTFICGGANLSIQLINKANHANLKVYNVYGLTETSSIASYNIPDSNLPSSVGKLSPINQYKIINQELYIKGPTVSQFCIDSKQLKNILDKDGWLKTHDIVEITDKDYLIIKGRKDEAFKLSSGLFATNKQIKEIVQSYISIKEVEVNIINDDKFEVYLDKRYIDNKPMIIDACINLNKKENFSVQNIKFTEKPAILKSLSFKKEENDKTIVVLNITI